MKTVKLLFFAAFMACNLTTTFSQTHVNREWMTEFGYPDTLAWSKAIPLPGSENEVHVGNTKNAQQYVEVLISVVLPDGGILWQETYTTGATHNCYGVDVVAKDDFIYVVGTTDNGGTYHDVLILKYDYDGVLQWDITYNSPYELDDVATAIDIDGTDLFIAGSSHGGTTDFDYLALKYDTAGVFIWDARYDGHDLIDVPVDIEAGWGRVAVTGASASSATNWDYTTVYFDGSNGSVVGDIRDSVQGVGYDMPYGMTTDDDGNIFVTGRTSSNGIDYDIRTVKMDSALNILWSETFDFQGLYDVGQTIELDDFGNIFIGGYVTRANNVEEMVLIKYDENGNELWNHVQAGEDFTQPAHVMDVSTSANGDLYFLGQEMANSGYNRLVVGKIDSTGATKWQRRTKQDNHEFPLSIQWYDDTLIYVNSAIQVGQEYIYKTRRYAQFSQDPSIEYVQDTIPAYRSKELIVRFKQNSINSDAIDNLLGKRTEFAPLEYYLTSEAMMRVDEAVKNTCTNLTEEDNVCGITAVKIFKQLTSDLDSTIARSGDTIRVPDFWTTLLLSFPESVDLEQARSGLANLDGYVAYVENNVIIELHTLLGIDDEYFVDNYQMSVHDEFNWYNLYNPDDPNDTTWNVSIQIKDAWEVYPEAGRPEIKCGVVDLLIDFRHPDFGFQQQFGNASTKVRGGYDFVSGTPLHDFILADSNTYHGTEVAGIIGALRNNDEEGIAGIAGGDAVSASPVGSPTYFDDKGVSLYSLGIWNYTGTGVNIPQPIQSVYDALVTGAAHPANGGMGLEIMNNSWGYSETGLSGVTDTNYILLKESILFANRAQVSQVAGRGNIGSQSPYRVIYPACMDDDWMMNVGGTGTDGAYPKNGEFVHPTYFNPMIGNEIDFAAPMHPDLIYTTLSTYAPLNPDDKSYTSFSQTSAAAPHVAGAVGLLMSYLNGNIVPNSNLAPEDAERILELSADNYDNMGQYSDSIGWGKINVGNAFRLVEQPYNTLYHISANLKELNFVSNSNIYIREPVQNDANIWFSNGTYNANIYRMDGWRNHSNILNEDDTIVAYWARPSASDVFEEALSDSLLPRHRLTIDYLDKDSCHMHGFIYEILDGSGNTIGWLPNDTTLTKWNLLEMKYTVLMHDSTAPTVHVESLKKDQNIFLYPNPSTDLQTVKINGFANQKVKITLYGIQGRSHGVVFEGKLNDYEQTFELDVSHLSNGFYLYDVRLETERRALRFIKQ